MPSIHLPGQRDSCRQRQWLHVGNPQQVYNSSDDFSDLCFDDQTVSCRHLKIYSIIYDQDDLRDVKPLIYAEDLSSNGTYWNEALIGRGNSAVLLNHGDRLRISPRITLKFHALLDYETDGADDSQILEMKVWQALNPSHKPRLKYYTALCGDIPRHKAQARCGRSWNHLYGYSSKHRSSSGLQNH